jgi:hypothetical protein
LTELGEGFDCLSGNFVVKGEIGLPPINWSSFCGRLWEEKDDIEVRQEHLSTGTAHRKTKRSAH